MKGDRARAFWRLQAGVTDGGVVEYRNLALLLLPGEDMPRKPRRLARRLAPLTACSCLGAFGRLQKAEKAGKGWRRKKCDSRTTAQGQPHRPSAPNATAQPWRCTKPPGVRHGLAVLCETVPRMPLCQDFKY